MKVFHAFSGVDSQLMAERRVFSNVALIGTMEVDIDAIISCALVHHKDRLEKELLKDWDNDKVDFAKLITNIFLKTLLSFLLIIHLLWNKRGMDLDLLLMYMIKQI